MAAGLYALSEVEMNSSSDQGVNLQIWHRTKNMYYNQHNINQSAGYFHKVLKNKCRITFIRIVFLGTRLKFIIYSLNLDLEFFLEANASIISRNRHFVSSLHLQAKCVYVCAHRPALLRRIRCFIINSNLLYLDYCIHFQVWHVEVCEWNRYI